MSVNVPTDVKVKEQDINGKLQLFGIYNAFAKGKVPSNKQIDVAMNSALEWKQLKSPSKKLSTEGQELVGDLRDVIEQAKVLLLSKNQGNLLQDFIWQTQSIGTNDAKLPNAPLDKDTAKQHGNQALEGLRTLGTLLITNGEFRKLLSDASVLLRDIAGDAATKTAGKVAPSEEQKAQLDEPAPENTWHDAPDLSKDNLKNQINQAKSKVPIGKKEAKEAAGDASAAANPDGSRDPAAAADRAAQEQQTGQATGVDGKAGAKAGAQNVKNKFSDNMDEDQKEKMRQYRERTNNYFKEKMPKDRREQIIYRLKKMVVEIQGHKDYQQAIDTLLRLAEEYSGHGKNLANEGSGTAKGAHNQDGLKTAEADLKTLLERFANGTSFDDGIESINQIYRDAEKDPELKKWFQDMNRYIRRCLQEQGYILQDESNTEWNQLYDHGNFLLRDRYRNHTNRVVDEFKFIGQQFDEDPQNKRFAKSMNDLFQRLGNDENGKATFKPHLIKDLTEVILPGFFQNVRYVPIPRIEYSDKMIDAVVENLCIEGNNLAPNVFEFGSDNHWRWGRAGNASKNKNKVMLHASGIQMDIRDVSYYVKKKQGFPGITDKGIMDIFLGGTGLSFKVAMETADKSDKNHFFKINSVNVDLQHMNIKVKQSNHKLLFGLFKPLLLKVLRPVILKVAEKQIRDNVQQLDAYMFRIKKEADRATEEAKSNPSKEKVENMYQRYFSAAQREMQKSKDKKEAAKAKAADKDAQVNIAMTQHDSIFKNIKLPGGISTKATEYKDLADKGDKWESPVFSIGSARESSNIAGAADPTRKPHPATPAVVREKGDGLASSAGNAVGSTPAASGTAAGAGITGVAGSAMPNSGVPGAGMAGSGTPANLGETATNGLSNGAAKLDDGATTLGQSNPVLQGRV